MNKVILALIATVVATSCLAHTSITAYGTYWDAENEGTGGGIRFKETFLGFAAVEARGGYVSFDKADLEVIPLDVSINARLPFFISPYVGIGAGYFSATSDNPGFEDEIGYFAQLGLEVTFLWVGAMAEVRMYNIDGYLGEYLDGPSANLGLLIKW